MLCKTPFQCYCAECEHEELWNLVETLAQYELMAQYELWLKVKLSIGIFDFLCFGKYKLCFIIH